MKVCQINCIYGVGSTGKLTRDLHCTMLSKGIDSFVIVPEKNQFTDEKGCYTIAPRWQSMLSAVFRRLTGLQYDGAFLQTGKLISILKNEQPDIVHLQCINGNNINVYRLLKYLAKKKVHTLLTLHAEFPYTGGCGHAYDCNRWLTGCGHCPIRKEATQSVFFDLTKRTWKKWSRVYSLFDSRCFMYTAVSPWLLGRARKSPMFSRFQGSVVLNGINETVFHFVSKAGYNVRQKYGINNGERILLFVTASFYPQRDDLKGGRYVVDLARRFQNASIKILVAANRGDGSDLPDNIVYIGRAKTQEELATLYSAADLSLVVSRRETFSLPVAESLCCGTPVVGFKAGGPESIAIKSFSCFVDYGDMDRLEESILTFLGAEFDRQVIITQACSQYSQERMFQSYLNKYQELLSYASRSN